MMPKGLWHLMTWKAIGGILIVILIVSGISFSSETQIKLNKEVYKENENIIVYLKGPMNQAFVFEISNKTDVCFKKSARFSTRGDYLLITKLKQGKYEATLKPFKTKKTFTVGKKSSESTRAENTEKQTTKTDEETNKKSYSENINQIKKDSNSNKKYENNIAASFENPEGKVLFKGAKKINPDAVTIKHNLIVVD